MSFRRVELLLGSRLQDATEQHLQRLCDGQVTEETDLEFKQRLYGNADSEKRSLAGDVAAIANTQDGVIILGVSASAGAAQELSPVELAESEELRIRQIIASTVAPSPQFSILRVASSKSERLGYYLLVVPRSQDAPHAVRVGESLRYPRRDGPMVRWLAESEVADSYRERFRRGEDRRDRLKTAVQEGSESLALEGSLWLAAGLVPGTRGYIPISQRTIRSARETWVGRWGGGRYGRRLFSGGGFDVVSGVERIIISAWPDQATNKSKAGHAELYEDGSGFAAISFYSSTDEAGSFQLFDEGLVEAGITLIGLLAEHAVIHAGAGGDAVASMALIGDLGGAVSLIHTRQFGFPQQFGGTKVIDKFPEVVRSLNLEEVTGSVAGLLIAARLLLTSFFQAFGLPEVPQISEEGKIRLPYIAAAGRERLEVWAQEEGVELLQTNLDQEP